MCSSQTEISLFDRITFNWKHQDSVILYAAKLRSVAPKTMVLEWWSSAVKWMLPAIAVRIILYTANKSIVSENSSKVIAPSQLSVWSIHKWANFFSHHLWGRHPRNLSKQHNYSALKGHRQDSEKQLSCTTPSFVLSIYISPKQFLV